MQKIYYMEWLILHIFLSGETQICSCNFYSMNVVHVTFLPKPKS